MALQIYITDLIYDSTIESEYIKLKKRTKSGLSQDQVINQNNKVSNLHIGETYG
jgi:hypothetical protein